MTDTLAPARILLVDDSRMDVELTLDAFRDGQLKNRIDVAMSGQAALDHLAQRCGVGPDGQFRPYPDLILLDLKMPGIGGFEVLRRIKADPILRRIPVVVLTSSREEGDRALSYDCGANSYLVKPVSFEGFLGVVRSIEDYWLSLNVGAPMATREPPRGDR